MTGDDLRSQRLTRQLRKDVSDLVDDIVGSPDLQDVFDERRWPYSVITQLKINLLSDEDFLRRLTASYTAVIDRATRLDEHNNVKPQVTIADVAAALEKPRVVRLLGLLALVVVPAIVGPILAIPDSPLLLPAIAVLATVFYFVPPIDEAVAEALPETIRRRRAWGRLRWRLRWGFTRLRWDWKTTIRNEVVLPEVLARVNAGAHRVFSHQLRFHRVRSYEWSPVAPFLIPTAAVQRLGREMRRGTRGAVALAGRRGVGKTTLLEALVAGTLPGVDTEHRLCVMVSAPARYELREFVLHLHTVVCREVLALLGNPRVAAATAAGDRWDHHLDVASRRSTWRVAARRLTRATGLLALSAAVATLLFYRDLATLPAAYGADVLELIAHRFQTLRLDSEEHIRALAAQILLALGIVAAAGNVIGLAGMPLRRTLLRLRRRLISRGERVAGWWRASGLREGWRTVLERVAPLLPRRWKPRVLPAPAPRRRATLTGIEQGHRVSQLEQPMQALASLATEQLRRIRFLQTHTSGWSGKIDGPKSLGLTVTRSIAQAEQPWTQPEVVEQLRGFLDRAATTLIRAGQITGITIAIDELDKFADPAQAHEFVNEIKTVFGVSNCLFMVSVSDDALAAFERRGIPVRDALDSAFTTMIAVAPFTLEESCAWLDRHVVGLPTPYACLCYCLSAGIPRELDRAMATLIDLDDEYDTWPAGSDNDSVTATTQPAHRELGEVTRTVIADDVAAKLSAFTHAAGQLAASAAVSEVIVTLNTVGALTHADTADLRQRLDLLATTLRDQADACDSDDLIRLCHEAAAYGTLCAALLEIFNEQLDEETLQQLRTGPRAALDTLAEARRALAVEPLLTWSLVTDVRKQVVAARLSDSITSDHS